MRRFDMIFILLDKPDENMDLALSEHVLAMHSGGHVLLCTCSTWHAPVLAAHRSN